jgi:hypothetical protein
MADRKFNVVSFDGSRASAILELRRQLEQAYALVAGARALVNRAGSIEGGSGDKLLEMAEEVLSDLKYIDRLDPLSRSEE